MLQKTQKTPTKGFHRYHEMLRHQNCVFYYFGTCFLHRGSASGVVTITLPIAESHLIFYVSGIKNMLNIYLSHRRYLKIFSCLFSG
jgi:hypothetical protein